MSPKSSAAYKRIAPFPAQVRRPSASCSASGWRQPTLSTISVPALSRAGATQAVKPPGWKGFPTLTDQRSVGVLNGIRVQPQVFRELPRCGERLSGAKYADRHRPLNLVCNLTVDRPRIVAPKLDEHVHYYTR